MWDLVTDLWPLPRSLTGDGNRATLARIGKTVPLDIHEVHTGTKIWSWTVPDEWAVHEAFIESLSSDWSISWADNPLHLLGYSTPTSDQTLYLEQLEPHLHTLPDQPDAIPYLTSYYQPRWGFCLTQNQKNQMGSGPFRVVVDTQLAPGSLTWAEATIYGNTGETVLFSTYICHPNLANDNLSGMVVATKLAEYIQTLPNRRYTYRFVFAPETLGTLCYLHTHIHRHDRIPIAGWVLTNLGGPGEMVYKPTKRGDTLTDRVSRHVASPGLLTRETPFVSTGSDERYYCSPRIDWPVGVFGKPIFHDYPEYHTSDDNLDFISEESLLKSLSTYLYIVDALEGNRKYWLIDPGIPKLDEVGLYPTLGAAKDQKDRVRDVMDMCMFADGRDLLGIAEEAKRPIWELQPLAEEMTEKGVLTDEDHR